MPIVKVNNYSDSYSPVGVSALGTIVFDNVVFPGGIDNKWINDEGNPVIYNDVKLDSVSITVNRKKVIQKSRVSGRKGTVKEYITLDDYIITLSAIIAPETFSLLDLGQIGIANVVPGSAFAAGAVGFTVPDEPVELLNNLKLLDDVQDSVQIRCKHLNNTYGINKVVIEEMSDSKTTADTYAIRMRLVSDDEVNLKDFG